MKKRLKVNGAIIFVAAVLIITFPNLLLRPSQGVLFDEATRIMGFMLITLGQIIRTCARGYKSEHSENSQRLIQAGPYAVVRNPMYLGILLVGFGIILAAFQWWIAWLFLAVFSARYILLILKEEKKLCAAFPGEYRKYAQEVNRLFPSIKRMSERDIAEYLPLKIPWLKRELGPLLVTLGITLALNAWQYTKAGTIKTYLGQLWIICLLLAFFAYVIAYLIKRTQVKKNDLLNKGENNLS